VRYLILSDIHANVTALDAALSAAGGRWDQAVCLGDVVGYGPDPNEAVERIRSLGAVTIRGNHDKAVCGLIDAEDFNPVAQSAVRWTRERLDANNLRYLETLPRGPLALGGFTIFHGAFHDEDEYVFSPELALDGLRNAPTPVSFFGHTHIQAGFSLRGDEVSVLNYKPPEMRQNSLQRIAADSKYVLNPGSVGQPRDGDPRAAFAIASVDKNTIEFWRVSYDIEGVQSRMLAAGLPEPLILRLSFGR
jgi:predicted phosphodiesterase